MAITTINVGSTPNDGSGDSIRVAFQKSNANFTELQSRIGNLATGGGTTGLSVNGPVEITTPTASPGLFTGTFRLRATPLDPYFDIATVAQGFSGGPVAGITTFTNPQTSTSTTTGAVVITGGLGVGGRATLDNAVVNGNIAVVNLNLTAGGQITLPDGTPFSFDVIANAATQAEQIALKAPINSPAFTGTPSAPTAAAGTNNTQLATTQFVQTANAAINANIGGLILDSNDVKANVGTLYLGNISTNANLGAYQAWANLTLSTVANAVDQQTAIETLTSNAATQSVAISDLSANLGIIYLGNVSTQANLGAYQTWANLTLSTVANAVNQQESIDNLLSNAAAQAVSINDLYSNAATQSTAIDNLLSNSAVQAVSINDLYSNAATQSTAIGDLQSNAAAQAVSINDLYSNAATQSTAIGDLQSNAAAQADSLNTLFSNAAAQAVTLETFDANIGTLYLGNLSTQANLGSYQSWANLNLAPLSAPVFAGNIDVADTGNLFVKSPATFTSNIEITPTGNILSFADLTQVDSNVYITDTATLVSSGTIATNANIVLETKSNLWVSGDLSTGWANVNIYPGANVHVAQGAEFSIFGGNVTVYKNTTPIDSLGAAGDFRGMIHSDGTHLYICTGSYNGSTNIWFRVGVSTF